MSNQTINEMYCLMSLGKINTATNSIVYHIDTLLFEGRFDSVSKIFSTIKVDKFLIQHVSILTGILMITFSAKKELGDSRKVFLERCVSRFNTLGMEVKRIERIRNRLE